jgi:hypothetical protein
VTTAGALLTVLAGVPAAAAGPGRVRSARAMVYTQNWAGYRVPGNPGTVREVQAEWAQPAATCPDEGPTAASFWVGLDGQAGDTTLEQTGTVVDCTDGTPVYQAWYEMWPGDVHRYNDPVAAGDRIRARVTYLGGDNHQFELAIEDVTQRWEEDTYEVPPDGRVPRLATADVVVERPRRLIYMPLANFGIVSFQECRANGQPIGAGQKDAIVMRNLLNENLAIPRRLSDDGTAFEVRWYRED